MPIVRLLRALSPDGTKMLFARRDPNRDKGIPDTRMPAEPVLVTDFTIR